MTGASGDRADPDARRASSAAGCRDPGLARVVGGPAIEDQAGLGHRGEFVAARGPLIVRLCGATGSSWLPDWRRSAWQSSYMALRFLYTPFYDTLGVAPEAWDSGRLDLLVRSAGLIMASALAGVFLLEVALFAGFSDCRRPGDPQGDA